MPLFERFGVPVVELVDDVGVRRRPPEYICCGYCEFMVVVVVVVGDAATGKTPELVVLVLECPGCESKAGCAGRIAIPGFAIGLRRTGKGP